MCAAYIINLLDRALPGLYNDMIRSGSDPGLKEHMRSRINGLHPNPRILLYDYIARIPDTNTGAREALLNTMRRLGLPDRPA
jgi:hypothetical protein